MLHKWSKQIMVFIAVLEKELQPSIVGQYQYISRSQCSDAVDKHSGMREINLADFTLIADDRPPFSIGHFSC